MSPSLTYSISSSAGHGLITVFAEGAMRTINSQNPLYELVAELLEQGVEDPAQICDLMRENPQEAWLNHLSRSNPRFGFLRNDDGATFMLTFGDQTLNGQIGRSLGNYAIGRATAEKLLAFCELTLDNPDKSIESLFQTLGDADRAILPDGRLLAWAGRSPSHPGYSNDAWSRMLLGGEPAGLDGRIWRGARLDWRPGATRDTETPGLPIGLFTDDSAPWGIGQSVEVLILAIDPNDVRPSNRVTGQLRASRAEVLGVAESDDFKTVKITQDQDFQWYSFIRWTILENDVEIDCDPRAVELLAP